MTRIFSKKWLTALISLVLVVGTYKFVQACAGGEWYIGDTTNLTPEAFVQDSTYAPFFYSYMFYYGIDYDTFHNTRFNEVNVKEWSEYLGNSVDTSAIDYLLYKANLNDILKITTKATNPSIQLPDSLQRYFIRLHAGNPPTENFLQYLNTAKQAETYASVEYTYWDDHQPKRPSYQSMKTFSVKLQAKLASAKDPFMKERYWFQLVRFYYFYDESAAISLFEKDKLNFPKNNMFYRTMAYAAGAYLKQKQYAQANYYYSLVFDGDKLLRTVAHYSFKPQEESDWQQTLNLCQSREEKATLWQMLGIFYKDEMRSMKEILSLDPASPKVDVLLTRYVNSMESSIQGFSEKNKDSIVNSKKQEFDWIFKIAREGKVSNPFLWNTTAGYLSFLQGNYAEATDFYHHAAKSIVITNKLAQEQLRLLVLINSVGKLKAISSRDENALLPEFQWLFFDTAKNSHLRTIEAQSWVEQTMSKKYAQQKDMPKSECFNSSQLYYTEDTNVTEYRKFLENSHKTPYENFCEKLATVKLRDVYTYQAVRLTYANNDLQQAVHLFEMAGDSVTLLANPFNGKIQDCHDCDFAAPQKVKYTQGKFVQKLIEMEKGVASGQDVYSNALLLGNAFYNISYYGNARHFYESYIIDFSSSDPQNIDSHYRKLLTDNSTAYKFYQTALAAAQTDEQRAKCYYMMAKCERNTWYNQTFYASTTNSYNYYWDYKGPFFKKWPSFTKLETLSQTQYYKDVVKECGYFRKIVTK